MKNHTLINLDTDAISICKQDQSPWSKQEREDFLKDLNSQFPDLINFEADGYFKAFIVVKAKNYIMQEEDGTITYKGSSIKTSTKEPILRKFMEEVIRCMLDDEMENLVNIYNKYIKLAKTPTDIKEWCIKKTLTKPILNCKGYTEQDIKDKKVRRNETEVWDAIKDRHVQEGDKVYVFPAILEEKKTLVPIMKKNKKTGELEQTGEKEQIDIVYGLSHFEDYRNNADTLHLVKRVYDTMNIFKNVVDMEKFPKYHLSRHKEELGKL